MNSAGEKVSIDRVSVNHVPQKNAGYEGEEK